MIFSYMGTLLVNKIIIFILTLYMVSFFIVVATLYSIFDSLCFLLLSFLIPEAFAVDIVELKKIIEKKHKEK